MISIIWFSSFIAIVSAVIYWRWIALQNPGNSKMLEISNAIATGANAYLKKQYFSVSIFFAIMAILLYIKVDIIDFHSFHYRGYWIPIAFLSGGFLSALSGFLGMKIATMANTRTAWAAKSGLYQGLKVALYSGAVMSLLVVGLGLFHIIFWFFVLGGHSKTTPENMQLIANILIASGLGASCMALFARVGGGIFTKAADVAADLVGKFESGIPEDDPRNPATIADNVGDNVGDVAGMGADLYESYIGSILATLAIGSSAMIHKTNYMEWVLAPLTLSAFGIFASIIGITCIRISKNSHQHENQKVLLWALRKGIYISSALILLFAYALSEYLNRNLPTNEQISIFSAIFIGLLTGNIIGFSTEWYTSAQYSPTKKLAKQSETGVATLIIEGLALGQISALVPVLSVIFGMLLSFYATGGTEHFEQGLFGIGMASVGMLSTLGITLATDAYGPVADNAGGIAEMAGLPESVRNNTDDLDALGNTTAATGKGFAIASAALTSLSLLFAYLSILKIYLPESDVVMINLMEPNTIAALFIGALLPFFFTSLTMRAVGQGAKVMVEEVRKQFQEIPGLLQGTTKPNYSTCINISTISAQKKMIFPTLLAITTPIATGMVLGYESILGLLSGALTSGFILAVMMANAGGAWDNAKKFIESGELGGKGSAQHKAAVIGDTIGDPFKDTSGPSINILIKLMSMVSIIFASVFLHFQ